MDIDRSALRMYSGLHCSTVAPEESCDLWSSQSIPECIAAGTVGHVMQELLASVRDGADYQPTHLIFPSTVEGIPSWSDSRKAAYQVFSGRVEPTAITTQNQLERFITITEDLGTLPAFCAVSDHLCQEFTEWLEISPRAIIASVGPTTSVSLNRNCRCNFVMPQPMAIGMNMDDIREELIVRLGASFATLLHRMAIAFSLDQDGGLPALTGNWKITSLFDIDSNPASIMMFRPTLTVDVLNGAEKFLLLLWEILQEQPKVIMGTINHWYRGAPGGQAVVGAITADHDVIIAITKSIELVNELKGGSFEYLQLTEDMNKRNWLVNTDRWVRKRRWVIRKDVWAQLTKTPAAVDLALRASGENL